MIAIALHAFALLFSVAEAESVPTLLPVFQGDTAATLPRGRFLVSATQLLLPIQRRFSPSGKREGLNTELSKSLTWKEVLADDPAKSAQVGGLLDAYGISGDAAAGEYGGELKGRVDVTVPVIGYGLTDHVGVYLAVPIQKIRMQSRVAYRQSPSAKTLVNALVADEQTGTAQNLAESLNNGFADQLDKAGMQNNQDIDRTEVGDVRLEVPAVLTLRNRSAFAFTSSLVLPTGSIPDPRELYPLSSGQGRVQFGGRVIGTRYLSRRWRFDASSGFLCPLPGKREVRVPRNADDPLSNAFDEDARIRGGFNYHFQIQGRYQLSRAWALSAGAQHQRKFRESFTGVKFAAERYHWVAQFAGERLESVFANAEVSSLMPFLAGEFPFPAQLNLAVSSPITGRNSLAGVIGLLQTSLFF